MLSALYPDMYVSSVRKIDYEALWQRGIRGLLLDIDNTLLPYYVPEPGEDLIGLLRGLEERGFRLCIVSNGKSERVERFNTRLKLPFICHAKKPGRGGFEGALRLIGLTPSACAVIGDQVFTDVLGGNRLGLYTVLVQKVVKKDEWITAVKRPLEKVVLYFYRRKMRRLQVR